jgi:hypothetical protein
MPHASGPSSLEVLVEDPPPANPSGVGWWRDRHCRHLSGALKGLDAFPPEHRGAADLLTLEHGLDGHRGPCACPRDFVAVGVIVSAAAVIGRKVAIRPKRQDDWVVLPNLWDSGRTVTTHTTPRR